MPHRLQPLFDAPGIQAAPAVYDCLGAALAEQAGFPFLFTSGFGLSAALLGKPDMGYLTATEMIGADHVWHIPNPEMGGEDFAYFSQAVPSMMFRLGVRNTARGIVHPVHHPGFDVDEDALPLGAAALARMAADYVNRG